MKLEHDVNEESSLETIPEDTHDASTPPPAESSSWLQSFLSRPETLLGLGLAGLAFVIVLLFGIVGQVNFGLILLRLLLFSLLAFGVGFLLMFLLRQFMPEVFDSSFVPESSSPGRSGIDATIEDDEPNLPGSDSEPGTITGDLIDDDDEMPGDAVETEGGLRFQRDAPTMAAAIRTKMSEEKD